MPSAEKPSNVEILFYKSGNRDAARYVSAEAVYEEALDHGRMIGMYWSATGQVHRENVAANLPEMDSLARPLHVFELELDGQSLHNRWDWAGSSRRLGKRPGTVEAVVELRHQVRPVTVKVVTRMDGTAVLARYLEITNTGKAPTALGSITPWTGVLWSRKSTYLPQNPSFDRREGSQFSVGYFAGEDWGHEGDFRWENLARENFSIERIANGRSWGSPYYVLKNEATGEMFFAGLAWSARFRAEFSCRHDRMLSFRISPVAPAPMRVIAPGETVTSPELHLAPFHCGMDEAVAHWHRHMRCSVIPPRPKGKEMYTVANRVVEEPGDWILREIDIAAEVGVEAFMVDAGWYGDSFAEWPANRGDWNEGSWLPGGIAGIREYTHKKGLLFGLWHEAETLSEKSRTFKEHPDWMLSTDDNRRRTGAVDLANPAAAKWIADTILHLVKDFKLDFYKLDYNISVGEGGQSLRAGYAESEFWRHYEVLYAAYDRVRKECPDACLENCASGGGRNDLGMLSRFHYACESDYSMFPYSIRTINAMTLFVPPESICYYHNHIGDAHTTAGLDTHLRVMLFGLPIFVGFGAQNADRSTDHFRKTRRYIELHKGFCRPVLVGKPIVYHHTPDIGLLTPAPWCVLEYALADRSRGYVGVFKLEDGSSEYLLRLRGVEFAAQYAVTLDNHQQKFRASGHELATAGLNIVLDSALTSELVLYERVPNVNP